MNQKYALLFFIVVLCKGINAHSLKLKQVLIFSRHNIRTPLGTELFKYSQKIWPTWNEKRGYLTQRGALIEGYMGEYFSEWFDSEQFLPKQCPTDDTVHIYANSVQRTIETAKKFVNSAFKDCNLTVHYKMTNIENEMDPIFHPIIRNKTDAYKNMVFEEINRKIENSNLSVALSELNKILDIKNSDICRKETICDLNKIRNEIYYEVGQELQVYGARYIGNTILDSFVMSYYESLPTKDVAWGLLDTPEKWEIITEIGRQDQYIRYTTMAKEIAAPLVNYLTEIFLSNKPKLTLIMGHDFNQNAVFHSMGFKSIRLPNHYENFPIGGKIVFQRWTDGVNDYLKVEYIYASWDQIRNGTRLSMNDPPQRVLLELKWCNVDEDGFCPWNEFMNKL